MEELRTEIGMFSEMSGFVSITIFQLYLWTIEHIRGVLIENDGLSVDITSRDQTEDGGDQDDLGDHDDGGDGDNTDVTMAAVLGLTGSVVWSQPTHTALCTVHARHKAH